MGRQEDLSKTDRNIKEAEAQLTKLQSDIGTLTKEIERLATVQGHLQENLGVLKKEKIVAIAAEFKKAKDALKTAMARIKLLAGNRENSLAHYNKIQKYIDKARAEHEKLTRSIENNVVAGKFGGRNNGQG